MTGDMHYSSVFGIYLWRAVAKSAARYTAMLAMLAAGIVTTNVALASPFQIQVTDDKGARLRDAVVSLRPTKNNTNASRARPTASATPLVIEQQDREFVPRVTVIPVGSRVSFPNNDAVP
ncbi:MAG: hypothetical protein ACRDAM_12930, partial [Casimicrobium sp.]